MTELLQFEKEYRVHVYETGPDGKLSLTSLFNYMQDIASDHAEKLGFGRDDLMRDNRFWVLSRMYAEIDNWPLWEDTIILKTWPNGTDKLFALRNYEVKYPDGKHIAYGTSSWIILDRATKKVQRPDVALSHFNRNFESQSSPLRYAAKIESVQENTIKTDSFRVKISDLDVNLHTNNVRYLQWINDTYDLDFVMKNVPQSAEINYLSESLFNEEVFIQTAADRNIDGLYNHSVIRSADNKELCRMRIGWQRNRMNQD
jgi:medium-chain acyl-[acyl-carrier-protein] hydrolase